MIKKQGTWYVAAVPNRKYTQREKIIKWIISGTAEEFTEKFGCIDTLVEKNIFLAAKYNPKKDLDIDILPDHPPIMLVYCYDYEREQALHKLIELDLAPEYWTYENETLEQCKKQYDEAIIRDLEKFISMMQKKS